MGIQRIKLKPLLFRAVGESGLSPTASNPSGWEGIFQFDQPTWAGAGGRNMYDPQQNIDNYFNLAKQRGLTPQTMRTGVQLGTQVSIGGPWHPENAAKGHLDQARKNAQQYLDAYTGGGTQLSAAFTPMPYGLPGNTNINYGGQGFPANGFMIWPRHLELKRQHTVVISQTLKVKTPASTGEVTWKNLEALRIIFSHNNPAIKQGIYQNPNTGFRTGISMGRPVGPDLAGTTDPGYYSRGKNDWIDHTDHFHTAFSAAIPSPGQGYTQLAVDQTGQPVPDPRPQFY